MPSEVDPLLVGAAAQSDMDQHSRMYRMEERRRQRLMISLAVLALMSGMMGALFVWRLQVARAQHRAELPTLVAGAALDQLNRHTNVKVERVPKKCTSTLLIMRHCEKEGPGTTDLRDGSEHCSYIGYERAEYLSSLFGSDPQARWPTPAHLFALTPDRGNGDHLNFREWETLKPLSDHTGIVSEVHNLLTLPKNYFELLQSGSLCDQVAVVSWKHEFIPQLAQQLACGPHNGCPEVFPEDSFDQVWQLTYIYHPALPTTPLGEAELRHKAKFTPMNGDELEDEATSKNNDDEVDNSLHRQLKHHNKDFSRHGWNVYATINYQNFDPLAFSKTNREAIATAASLSSSSSFHHNERRADTTSASYNAEGHL